MVPTDGMKEADAARISQNRSDQKFVCRVSLKNHEEADPKVQETSFVTDRKARLRRSSVRLEVFGWLEQSDGLCSS